MEKEIVLRSTIKNKGEEFVDMQYYDNFKQLISTLKDFHYSILCENKMFNNLVDKVLYSDRRRLLDILLELFKLPKGTSNERQDLLCKYIYILTENEYTTQLEIIGSNENYTMSLMLLLGHTIIMGLYENDNNTLLPDVKRSIYETLDMLKCGEDDINVFLYNVMYDLIGEL